MRHVPLLETWILATATGVLLVASVFLSDVRADPGSASSEESRCSCPDASKKSARPKFAKLKMYGLDEADEVAALESIQMGLSRMDDGAPFVWRRANGKLSGIVRPTASFRNAKGNLCRHVVVLLTTGFKTRTAEGIACRSPDRRWVLEG